MTFRSGASLIALLTLVTCLEATGCSGHSFLRNKRQDSGNDTNVFDWSAVEGKDTFEWQPCYEDGLECARLNVPLDWSNPNSSSKAGIAVLREVGANSTGMPMLFNPGGPSISAIDDIFNFREDIRKRIGSSYDLIAFDPRGVGYSTPELKLFPDGSCERQLFFNDFSTAPGFTNDSIAQGWRKGWTMWQYARASNLSDEVLPYIHTDGTARDMKYIAEMLGKDKLAYYGISYGSILGQTFATMFPNNIERLVIDGIIDPDDYYSGINEFPTIDSEKTLDVFFQTCHQAGPDLCPFYASTVDQMWADYTAILSSLRHAPLFGQVDEQTFGFVDYQTFRSTLFFTLYNSLLWPLMAPVLAGLREGDATPALSMFGSLGAGAPDNRDTLYSIRCNDGLQYNRTVGEQLDFVVALNESLPFGDLAAQYAVYCANYPQWGVEHFQGPVGAANTSFPLLIVSNTADPATPYYAGQYVQTLFPGSALLTRNAPGHGSLGGIDDNGCTDQIMLDYMDKGVLPDGGAANCTADLSVIFSGNGTGASNNTQEARKRWLRV